MGLPNEANSIGDTYRSRLLRGMDISSAIADFPEDFGSADNNVDSEDEENETEATRAMVAMQNKKKKKSGGFQCMGKAYKPHFFHTTKS